MEFAERLEESLRNEGVAVVRARLSEAVPQDFDGEHCACGEAIPAARLALNKFRCVECQMKIECGFKR